MAAGAGAPRVRATEVSKAIGEVTLLAPVSLVAEPGTALVIRGRNGIGKTTLLQILAGLMEPTTGEVLIDDRRADERDKAIRARVATLLGAPAAYRDLTLADHLTLIDATWGRDPATCADRVAAALEELGIGALAERFPHELSSGQGQLFRLALTLFRPGDLLILDEPEQRLDTDKRVLIGELLQHRRAAGTTLIVATHDPELSRMLADAVLDLGWDEPDGDDRPDGDDLADVDEPDGDTAGRGRW